MAGFELHVHAYAGTGICQGVGAALQAAGNVSKQLPLPGGLLHIPIRCLERSSSIPVTGPVPQSIRIPELALLILASMIPAEEWSCAPPVVKSIAVASQ